jgi:hypothetical protein
MAEMATMEEVKDALEPLGFQRLAVMHGDSYKVAHHVVIIPTRGAIHWRVVQAWQALIAPMNQHRAMLFAAGDEVGHAYNRMIQNVLADPVLSTWPYVMTLEDDNLPPCDAFVRLHETIRETGADAVSGLYFTKGDYQMPMAYGDPDEFRSTGKLDFRPRDVRECVAAGKTMEVNGIAMGCALWKTDLFRQINGPWFQTVADVSPFGPVGFTQDLKFCDKAKRLGKKFYVDCRVKVGHLDVQTGIVY